MMAKQLQTYQDNAVTTASGPQLTMMLYNGCIKFINQAKSALENNDFENKNYYIQRAQDIVQEFMITLDQTVEISQQMMPLYEYIYHQLQQANIKNEMKYLDEALEYVTDFRDTWKEVMLRVARDTKATQEERV
ncbi:MAG TPA: flagellar export chaperone FliS [Pseudogracilibacillus sp.]|nr:flagellar export chaperone FliS [Pseudogracilibacillus sp.]